MRVRIIEPLTGSPDGTSLDRFAPGSVYDVRTLIGCYLLAIGAAEPVADESPALVALSNQPVCQRLDQDKRYVRRGLAVVPRHSPADRGRRKER